MCNNEWDEFLVSLLFFHCNETREWKWYIGIFSTLTLSDRSKEFMCNCRKIYMSFHLYQTHVEEWNNFWNKQKCFFNLSLIWWYSMVFYDSLSILFYEFVSFWVNYDIGLWCIEAFIWCRVVFHIQPNKKRKKRERERKKN